MEIDIGAFEKLMELSEELARNSRAGEEALSAWSPYSQYAHRFTLEALKDDESDEARKFKKALEILLSGENTRERLTALFYGRTMNMYQQMTKLFEAVAAEHPAAAEALRSWSATSMKTYKPALAVIEQLHGVNAVKLAQALRYVTLGGYTKAKELLAA